MLDDPYMKEKRINFLWDYNLTFPFLYGIMILLLLFYTNGDIFHCCIFFLMSSLLSTHSNNLHVVKVTLLGVEFYEF